MRRVLHIGFVAAMVVASAVVVSTRMPAHAVQGLEAGYWWQAQPAGAPLPPPGNVPANGLWVSGSEPQPVAISAVRFLLGPTETLPVLHLKVHSQNPPKEVSSGSNVGQIVVLACPATSAWKPASAGAWDDRPKSNCAGAQHGSPSSDGATVSFDLGSIAVDGKVDIVLVPGTGAAALPNPPAPAPATPQPSGFDLTFDPVTPDQLAVTPGTSEETPAPFVPAADNSGAASDLGTQANVGGLSSSVPDFNYAANAVVPSAGQAAGATPSIAGGSVAPQLRGAGASEPKANHGYRALAVVLLAALLWWAWRQAMPARPNRRTIYDGPPAPAA